MEKKTNIITKSLLLIAAIALPFVFSCTNDMVPGSLDDQEARPTMIDPWTAIDQSPYVKQVTKGTSSLEAGHFQTKSHLEMVGGSFAQVVWDASDSFTMYAWDSEHSIHYTAAYSTTAGGELATFTTSHTVGSLTPQHSIHAPGTAIKSSNDGSSFFGLNLPSSQTAVDNDINKQYLYSYARSVNQGDHLTFNNILALVRFKMSGDIANSVTSVTLTGASALAGDFVIMPSTSGIPDITLAKKFTGDASSESVTLTGTFKKDTYYYFAVIPGKQTSFSLKFSGSSGSTTKIAVKTVTFEQGKISDLGTFSLGVAFTDPATPSTATIKYMSASTAKKVTIAVIPDGFTLNELDKYEMLAKSAINTLFEVEPYKSYKEYFNVYILKVASNQSGANITDGHGNITTTRDCYFGSKWGVSSYSDMAANSSTIETFVTNNCPDIPSIHPFNEVPVLMIINDSRYGGICHSVSDGKGYAMVPYTYNGGSMTWSYPDYEASSESDYSAAQVAVSSSKKDLLGHNAGNWLNTMVHEFGGHCFGRLADEYWNADNTGNETISEHVWDVPFSLNVSSQYSTVGWQHLLDTAAALGSPYNTRIGKYQGGDTYMKRRWRSEQISCMIDNRFYFSTFQRELIVRRIMTLAGVAFNKADFWAKDNPLDPVRDMISSPVMGDDPVMPRPVPLLPPPVLYETDW